MKKKLFEKFLWVLTLGQAEGPDAKIQKHPLGWIYYKSY